MLAVTVLHAHLNVIPHDSAPNVPQDPRCTQQCPLCACGSRVRTPDVRSVKGLRQRGERWVACASAREILTGLVATRGHNGRHEARDISRRGQAWRPAGACLSSKAWCGNHKRMGSGCQRS